MRLLIYCGSRQAALDVSCAVEGSMAVASPSDLRLVLPRWRRNPDGILVVAGIGLITAGWSVPVGTNILFDQSFPDDPALRAQALARVGRATHRGQGSGTVGA